MNYCLDQLWNPTPNLSKSAIIYSLTVGACNFGHQKRFRGSKCARVDTGCVGFTAPQSTALTRPGFQRGRFTEGGDERR